MREIKFRIWYAQYKKMDYDPSYAAGDLAITMINDFFKTEDGDIVMQYTGLKDKNGKEIYEGDIVDVGYFGRKEEVKYFAHAGFACFMPFLDDGHHWNSFNCEVIGNKYENPDLAK